MRVTSFSLLRPRMFSVAVALDSLLYTSPHRPRITCTVNNSRKSFHGCKLHTVRLSSYCTRPHPCTVTAAHHPHTRPPDIQAHLEYQSPLVNIILIPDLCRPRARPPRPGQPHLALAITRSGTCIDIPCIRWDMSDDDRGSDRASSSLAARGGIDS
jgi:hypothetical protein